MWVFILCPGLFKIGGGEHMTCGILVPKQGLNWGHWQWEFKVLTTGLPGSSLFKKQLKDSCACVLSCVWLFATSWTVAHQAPLSLGFARQEYWSGLPFSSPGVTYKYKAVTKHASWASGLFRVVARSAITAIFRLFPASLISLSGAQESPHDQLKCRLGFILCGEV